MRSHLRLVTATNQTKDTPDDTALDPPAAARNSPRWWRALVIFTLRHGRRIPPLCLLYPLLLAWRKKDVSRALWRIKGEIDWDGEPGFNLLVGFKRTIPHRGNDPDFWETCERAIDTTRTEILGLTVTFDDEVMGQGYGTIARWIDWRCGGKSTDPFPPEFTAQPHHSRSQS